jgi:hypothetical protein
MHKANSTESANVLNANFNSGSNAQDFGFINGT